MRHHRSRSPWRPRGAVPAGLALGLGLALAGCAMLPPPGPQSAHLTRDRLAVTLSDGSRCIGPRPPDAGPAGWSGQLQDCPVALSYAVQLDPKPNPLRQVVEAVFAVLTIDDQLPAMADVTLRDAAGRSYAFRSPPPLD